MLAPFEARRTQQAGLGRQARISRGSKTGRRNPATNKTHKKGKFSNGKSYEDNKSGCDRDSEWYNWGPQPLEGGLHIPQTLLPAHSALLPCKYSSLIRTPPRPLLKERHPGGGWGQVHSGGAFPRPVFPRSRWNFQRATDPRHWTPARPPPPPPSAACEPLRSRLGSRKLLDFPVASAFARNRNPGPAPRAGWGLGDWGLGPA